MSNSQGKTAIERKRRAAELIVIDEGGGACKQRRQQRETERRMREAAFPELFVTAAFESLSSKKAIIKE